MQIRCPVCHKNSSVQDGFAGRLVKCPYCSEAIVAPSAEEVSAAEAAAPQQSWAPPPPAPAPRELAPPELPAFYGPLPPPRPSRPTQMMPPGAPPFPTPPPMPPTPGGRPTQVQPPGSAAAKPTQLVTGVPPAGASGDPAPTRRPTQMAPPGAGPLPVPPPPPPPPMPPRPPAPERYDIRRMVEGYKSDREEMGRRHYRFDPEMPSASATRERNTWNRESLETSARGRGHGRREINTLLEAFDKTAKSAERLAERNDYLGQKEAEQAAKKAERELQQSHEEEMVRRKKHDAELRAGWQRMTGKNSMGDALFGAERLERDPRGYLMNVASMVMSGPVMSKMAGLFSGTMGGAAKGYQMGGVAGAAVGAAVGATGDVMNLGRNASPQAGDTFDQSWELFKTRLGSAAGADKFLNMVSSRIQSVGDALGTSGSGPRSFMGRVYSHMGDVPMWLGGPTGGAASVYGGARGLGGYLMGEKAPEDKKPRLMAPPTIAGVGGAMGGTSSYEQYALSSGMSSLSASPIEQEKMLEQLKNMVGRLDKVIDNTEMLKTYTPAWR